MDIKIHLHVGILALRSATFYPTVATAHARAGRPNLFQKIWNSKDDWAIHVWIQNEKIFERKNRLKTMPLGSLGRHSETFSLDWIAALFNNFRTELSAIFFCACSRIGPYLAYFYLLFLCTRNRRVRHIKAFTVIVFWLSFRWPRQLFRIWCLFWKMPSIRARFVSVYLIALIALICVSNAYAVADCIGEWPHFFDGTSFFEYSRGSFDDRDVRELRAYFDAYENNQHAEAMAHLRNVKIRNVIRRSINRTTTPIVRYFPGDKVFWWSYYWFHCIPFQPDIINSHGYPVEVHNVTTKDGYVLSLYRIPGSPNSATPLKNKIPVLMLHGLFESSNSWIVQGPSKSLGKMWTSEHTVLGEKKSTEIRIRSWILTIEL